MAWPRSFVYVLVYALMRRANRMHSLKDGISGVQAKFNLLFEEEFGNSDLDSVYLRRCAGTVLERVFWLVKVSPAMEILLVNLRNTLQRSHNTNAKITHKEFLALIADAITNLEGRG